jgi:predicted alpha/beta-hydrolase family hydrolase
MSRRIDVEWAGGRVSAVVDGEGSTGILVAHGAGTDQGHPSIESLRTGLAAAGHTVMTFNYPYTERGSRRPDTTSKLVDCHRAAADHLGATVDVMVLAGRSMGGRMGTYLVAEGYPALGIVLYAYPLHPAGRPDRLRVDQFQSISMPMLFFQGTNDALSRMDLFEQQIARLPNAEVELLQGAGHGFRGGGWDMDSIVARYVDGTLAWVDRLPSGTT